jgi:cytochrome c oxidase subunit II
VAHKLSVLRMKRHITTISILTKNRLWGMAVEELSTRISQIFWPEKKMTVRKDMARGKRSGLAMLAALSAFMAPYAANASMGQPSPWQLNFQDAATGVMASIHSFHWLLLVIITAITLFVLALLVWCIVRYNARSNPTPSKFTHNTLLEVAWTVIPVMILVVIAIPSFRLLFEQQRIPHADLTIKATGYQWYWGYEYPDHGKFSFDSYMVKDADLKPGQPRLLAVDNEFVVPVGKVVRMQITAADVLHAFAVPSFGIKIDAVPGRLNETWFRAEKEGMFYGQCSELCGRDHAFMPIAVRVVSEQQFAAWVEQAKKKFASTMPASVALGDASSKNSN